jgi:hypothetical protein
MPIFSEDQRENVCSATRVERLASILSTTCYFWSSVPLGSLIGVWECDDNVVDPRGESQPQIRVLASSLSSSHEDPVASVDGLHSRLGTWRGEEAVLRSRVGVGRLHFQSLQGRF